MPPCSTPRCCVPKSEAGHPTTRRRRTGCRAVRPQAMRCPKNLIPHAVVRRVIQAVGLTGAPQRAPARRRRRLFEVHAGRVTVLLGASGAGKSTVPGSCPNSDTVAASPASEALPCTAFLTPPARSASCWATCRDILPAPSVLVVPPCARRGDTCRCVPWLRWLHGCGRDCRSVALRRRVTPGRAVACGDPTRRRGPGVVADRAALRLPVHRPAQSRMTTAREHLGLSLCTTPREKTVYLR